MWKLFRLFPRGKGVVKVTQSALTHLCAIWWSPRLQSKKCNLLLTCHVPHIPPSLFGATIFLLPFPLDLDRRWRFHPSASVTNINICGNIGSESFLIFIHSIRVSHVFFCCNKLAECTRLRTSWNKSPRCWKSAELAARSELARSHTLLFCEQFAGLSLRCWQN